MPRISRVLMMFPSFPRGSVAGEAEQVPAVVHELVDVGAAEDVQRTLFGADEVEHQHEEQSAEDRIRSDLAKGDGRDRYGYRLRSNGSGHRAYLLGILRPGRQVLRWFGSDFQALEGA